MAKALFRERMADAGCDVRVASAGFVEAGIEPPPEVVEVLAAKGVALSGHRSRELTSDLIHAADLVVTMTRQHLIEVVTTAPDAWDRAFTLVDLIRRGEAIGPVPGDRALARWVRQVHGGRTRSGLLRLDLADDIVDPMGGRPKDFEDVADHIEGLIDRLVALVCPDPELKADSVDGRMSSTA